MDEFLGKEYVMVSEENFETYLAHLGLGYFKRKIAISMRPVQCLTRNEDGSYKFTVRTAGIFHWEIIFQPDVEFDGSKPDGSKVRTKITFEDNVMKHRQYDPNNGSVSLHVLQFYPENTIVTTTVEGTDIVAKRIYKLSTTTNS